MTQSTPTTTTGASRPKFVGLAWSSLILGIVGVVFSPLPIINNISALIAVVGIVLAGIALFGSRKLEGYRKPFSVSLLTGVSIPQ
jgi:hypothetical protein